jgi:hypothetical protein
MIVLLRKNKAANFNGTRPSEIYIPKSCCADREASCFGVRI